MKEPVEAGRALAEAIAAETARRQITQEAAAALVGTTQQTFGKWVNRTTRPSDEACKRLAGYLGMTEAKVLELRGPLRFDPRDRQLLRRRVEDLERTTTEIVERLKRIDERLRE